MDPHVLVVRAAFPRPAGSERLFDSGAAGARILRSPGLEHVAVELSGKIVRFDVVEGSVTRGPVTLRFDVVDNHRLGAQLDAIRAMRFTSHAADHHRLARQLLALEAIDAREAGASLRHIADLLLGPGDWPGDGEHRKSRARRLLLAGAHMLRDGPRRVLAPKSPARP